MATMSCQLWHLRSAFTELFKRATLSTATDSPAQTSNTVVQRRANPTIGQTLWQRSRRRWINRERMRSCARWSWKPNGRTTRCPRPNPQASAGGCFAEATLISSSSWGKSWDFCRHQHHRECTRDEEQVRAAQTHRRTGPSAAGCGGAGHAGTTPNRTSPSLSPPPRGCGSVGAGSLGSAAVRNNNPTQRAVRNVSPLASKE
jgi:hypothetical protein